MEKKLEQKIIELANGRTYDVIRHVGNRLEVMYLGDYQPTVIRLKKRKTAEDIDLSKKKVSELKEICKRLGIPTSGKKKADLIEAIEDAT